MCTTHHTAFPRMEVAVFQSDALLPCFLLLVVVFEILLSLPKPETAASSNLASLNKVVEASPEAWEQLHQRLQLVEDPNSKESPTFSKFQVDWNVGKPLLACCNLLHVTS
jgi:hypothetical protein